MQKRPTASPRKQTPVDDANVPLLPTPLRWGLLTAIVLVFAGGLWYWNSPGRDELSRLLLRSQESLRQGNVAAAYADLQLALPRAPRSAHVLESLADLAIRQQLLDEAAQWIDRIPEDSPETTSGLQISGAMAALEGGLPSRAETWLHAALRNSSKAERQTETAHQLLVHLYLITFRDPELREQIAALDRSPESLLNGELLLQYCAGARTVKQGPEPQEWLHRSLQQEPRNTVIRAALASLLLQTNQREQARKLLREASVEDSDAWRLNLVRTQDLIDSGRYAEVAQILNELPAAADLDARTWVARGRIAFEQHNLEGAETAFKAASELDPLLTEPVYRLARQADATAESQERFRRADLLDRLHRAAVRASKAPQEKPMALEESSSLAAQLGQNRLALLLCRALVAEHPDLAAAKTRLRELEALPGALQPLSTTVANRPPELKLLLKDPPPASNKTGLNTDPETADRTLPEFRDVALSTGLKFRTFASEATSHWLMETLGAGVAVLDYDMDGWPDLFFAQCSSLPVPKTSPGPAATASLFRNQRGKGFEEITVPSGTADFGFGQGCSVGDFDNDGWPDLIVCHYGALRLYRNNGDGTFRDTTVESGIVDSEWSTSAAFGDFDRDGDLDLYVVHYVTAPWEAIHPCDRGGKEGSGKSSLCRPTDYPATQDSIWENRGDAQFVERTTAAGIIAPDGKGLAVLVEDFDNDGWPDIYVANDTTPSFLFHNLGRPAEKGQSPFSFREIGISAGVAVSGQGDAQSSMGLACADVDNNGYFDLFVTNFQEETNTFYRNLGELSFTDDTAKARLLDLNPPKMGWGCQFLDSQGRGRSDLFYVNGHLLHTPQSPSFYANAGDRFAERHLKSPYFQSERLGRVVASLDWDRDLRPDLAVSHLKGNVALLHNDSVGGASCAVELVGRNANRDAEGARIIVTQGSDRRVYRVSRGGGFFAANEKTVLIGLGSRGAADSCEVHWPNGERQQGPKLSTGIRYRVIEGQSPELISAP